MKFLVKEKILSLWGKHQITDENGQPVYRVKGKPSGAGHLILMDMNDRELGSVKGKGLTMMPKYYITINGEKSGMLKQKFTFFKQKFVYDEKGWVIQGNTRERDYEIKDSRGHVVAEIRKKALKLHNTYQLEVFDESEIVPALLMVLAIDLVKGEELVALGSM